MAVEAGGAEAATAGTAAGGAAGGGIRPANPAYRGAHRGPYKARHAGPVRPAAARQSSGRSLQPQVAGRKTAGQQGLQPQVAGKTAGSGGRMSDEERAKRKAEREQEARQQQGRARRQRAVTRLSSGTYHRIVIAEFLATVLIIAAAPFLVPRTSSSGTPEEEAAAAVKSASLSSPMTRLTAVCIVFFILALTANGARTGRIAAAFGALVMLGALLNATETWQALGQMFAGATAPPATAATRTGQ